MHGQVTHVRVSLALKAGLHQVDVSELMGTADATVEKERIGTLRFLVSELTCQQLELSPNSAKATGCSIMP